MISGASTNSAISSLPRRRYDRNVSQQIRLREGVITKLVGEELVLLDYERGIYYGLNDVGARLIALIGEGTSMAGAADRLLEEFDVSRQTLEADLELLLGELREQGLVSSG